MIVKFRLIGDPAAVRTAFRFMTGVFGPQLKLGGTELARTGGERWYGEITLGADRNGDTETELAILAAEIAGVAESHIAHAEDPDAARRYVAAALNEHGLADLGVTTEIEGAR